MIRLFRDAFSFRNGDNCTNLSPPFSELPSVWLNGDGVASGSWCTIAAELQVSGRSCHLGFASNSPGSCRCIGVQLSLCQWNDIA